MVGRTLGHYTILSELGAGAMGRVFLARDTLADRRVALKLVSTPSPEARERLIREARAAARLSHPNVVTLYTVEEADGELFLVQELVEGEPLAKRLERGPMGPQELLRLARELTAALTHAHAQGVLHRDLKPENVLVAVDGTFKVADFGIARLEGAPTMTAAGTLLGTLPYMAPERLRGHAGDARADLFSLGAILYEAMSGRRAFAGNSPEEVMHAALNEDPPRLEPSSARQAALADLIHRLLAKEARDRPPSAEVVAGILAGLAAETPPVRRRPWVAPAGAGLAVLLLVAVGWFLTRRTGTAAADEPSVAVVYFDNMADPEDHERLGPIAGNLLVTSLAQTPEVNVVGTERVLDVLRGLGRPGRGMDRGEAMEVARRTGARRMVTGSILQVSPVIVMTAELIEVRTGKVIDAYRIEGQPGQSVFQVVDLLGQQLMSRLASASEATRLLPVSQRASSDLEAVRRYLTGLEHLSHGEVADAVKAFESALARDSTFAQAHYQLAIARWWSGEPGNAESSLRHAIRHGGALSPTERAALEGIAALVEGDWKKADSVFDGLLRRYPDEKLFAYGLLEARWHGRNYEGAMRAGRRALAADSSFTLAAVHLVDAANQLRRFAEAESIARRALAQAPGNKPLWSSLMQVMLMKGDGLGALQVAEAAIERGDLSPHMIGTALVLELARDSVARALRYVRKVQSPPIPAELMPDIRSAEDYGLALWRGRFREAVGIATKAWRRHPASKFGPSGPSIPLADGIEAALAARDRKLALQWADSLGARFDRWFGRSPGIGGIVRVMILIELGEYDQADRNLRVVEAQKGVENSGEVRFARAEILGSQGNTDEALRLLGAAVFLGPAMLRIGGIRLATFRVLEQGKRYTEAFAVLDTLMGAPMLGLSEMVRLHLYRARTLEKLGRPAEAQASYRTFLRIWQDADPGTPEVEEARAALRRLERAGLAASARTRG